MWIDYRIKLSLEGTSVGHLVQSHAQSRPSFDAKSGCSGPCRVKFWKSPEREVQQPLYPFQHLTAFIVKIFSCYRTEISVFPLHVSEDMVVYKDIVVNGWRGCIYCGCVGTQKYRGSLHRRRWSCDEVVSLPPSSCTTALSSCHGQESGGLKLYLRFLRCLLSDWQSVVIWWFIHLEVGDHMFLSTPVLDIIQTIELWLTNR